MLAPPSAALAQVLHLNVVSAQTYASALSAGSEAICVKPSAAQHGASMITAQRTATVLNDNHADPFVPQCAVAVQRESEPGKPRLRTCHLIST